MRWRFLKSFQEGIERLSGKHVNFINNVCLVIAIRWSHSNILSQLTDFIDPAVACSINLNYIDVLACGNRLAAFTKVTRFTGFPICALKCFGVYAGRTCFPNAPGTSEEVGVANAA